MHLTEQLDYERYRILLVTSMRILLHKTVVQQIHFFYEKTLQKSLINASISTQYACFLAEDLIYIFK